MEHSIITPLNPSEIHLIQITDTHIFADNSMCMGGVNTHVSLARVISHIKAEEVNTDAFLLTGDLVHRPDETAYELLREQLLQLQQPVYCIPGNHDEPQMMYDSLALDNIKTEKVIRIGNWLIVMLNSHTHGTHAGRLGEDELDFLDHVLAGHRKCNVLIGIHHPPVSINSTWMDSMMLTNPEDFFSITDKFDNICGIIWGHIHQEFKCIRNRVHLYGAPSTCVQFSPGASEYSKDDIPAGYRRLILAADGTINTYIVRV